MKIKILIHNKILLAAAFILTALWVCLFAGNQNVHAAVASEGKIYLENIDVTGMNYEQICAVIDEKMEKYGSDIIEIYADDVTAYVEARELGLYYANQDLPDIIASMGMRGNVFARYKIDDYISKNGAIFFFLDLRVNPDAVYTVVSEKVTALNRTPVNMKLGRNEDGTFYSIPKIDGFHVLVDETAAELTNYLCSSWHGGVGGFEAVTEVDEAIGSIGGDISMITSELGVGSTNYDFNGKYAPRAANIENGTSKINGTLLYPGDTFSTEAMLVPFTEENGYQYAPGYENGTVVDTIGGGICQVSSTLYRAVLEAELEVVERYQHSMLVGYVDPSMDATIAENSLDFKFRNNTDSTIYIEGTAENGVVTFRIYGHETRDPGRTIAFESEESDRQEAKMELALDPNMEYGAYDYQDPHDGLSARAYKIVYQDGTEVAREHINSSYYVKSDGHLICGIKNAPGDVIALLEIAIAGENMGEMFILCGYDIYGNKEGGYTPEEAVALVSQLNAEALSAAGGGSESSPDQGNSGEGQPSEGSGEGGE